MAWWSVRAVFLRILISRKMQYFIANRAMATEERILSFKERLELYNKSVAATSSTPPLPSAPKNNQPAPTAPPATLRPQALTSPSPAPPTLAATSSLSGESAPWVKGKGDPKQGQVDTGSIVLPSKLGRQSWQPVSINNSPPTVNLKPTEVPSPQIKGPTTTQPPNITRPKTDVTPPQLKHPISNQPPIVTLKKEEEAPTQFKDPVPTQPLKQVTEKQSDDGVERVISKSMSAIRAMLQARGPTNRLPPANLLPPAKVEQPKVIKEAPEVSQSQSAFSRNSLPVCTQSPSPAVNASIVTAPVVTVPVVAAPVAADPVVIAEEKAEPGMVKKNTLKLNQFFQSMATKQSVKEEQELLPPQPENRRNESAPGAKEEAGAELLASSLSEERGAGEVSGGGENGVSVGLLMRMRNKKKPTRRSFSEDSD